jgi:chromosome segregation ATPase
MSKKRVILEVEALPARDLPSTTPVVTPVIHDLRGDVNQLATAATTFKTQLNQTTLALLNDVAKHASVATDLTTLANEVSSLHTSVHDLTTDMLGDSRITADLKKDINEVRLASTIEELHVDLDAAQLRWDMNHKHYAAASLDVARMQKQLTTYESRMTYLTTAIGNDLTKLGIT